RAHLPFNPTSTPLERDRAIRPYDRDGDRVPLEERSVVRVDPEAGSGEHAAIVGKAVSRIATSHHLGPAGNLERCHPERNARAQLRPDPAYKGPLPSAHPGN